jgi:predicted PurR-regulated permease PerM
MSANGEAALFGAVERRLFRVTAILFALVALAALVGGVAWFLGRTLSHFYNIILPLSVAGVLALVLYPVVDYLEGGMGLPRIAATSLIVLVFMAMIGGTVWLLVPIVSRQLGLFTEAAPGILEGWQNYLSSRFPTLTQLVVKSGQDGQLKELVPDMQESGRTLKSYAGILVGLSFVPLLLFFALLSGHRLRHHAREILSVFSSRTQQAVMHSMDIFLRQVTGFFQGQLVIAMIMGVMMAIGFTLIGLNGGIVIGLILGLLNIVPFLGTLVGLLIVLPIAYFQPGGSLQLLALSLLVFTFVQLVESWLLTPRIMANRSGLHPALVVISVFFWGIALGGIIGMILAVPLTAFIVAVWSQAKAGLTRSMTSDRDAIVIETPSGARLTEPEDPPATPLVREPTDGKIILT